MANIIHSQFKAIAPTIFIVFTCSLLFTHYQLMEYRNRVTTVQSALQANEPAMQRNLEDDVADLLFKQRIIFASTILLLLAFLLYMRHCIANLMERNRRKLQSQGEMLNELIEEQTKNITRQKEKAEIADKAKSDFLANMSHELRTPLNSILGLTRLLSESHLTGKQQELSSTILYSSEHLLTIVNDILDISKIEAGEIRLEQIGIDLEYLLASVMLMHETMASEKRIQLTRQSKAVRLPYVLGDPTRLSQVINNLINNAIKYTKTGQVKMDYDFTHTDPVHILFTCSVTDTGIGIPKAKIGIVFDKFVQVDIGDTRKYGGTGLGLAITKQLVTLMGGEITVKSVVGKGSTFTVTLPFKITGKLHKDFKPKKNRADKRCSNFTPEAVRMLIAEDNPMNQMLIRKLMERFGIVNYTLVKNGDKALQAYHAERFDVILMDCHMPKKSGYDVTTEIRQSEWLSGSHIPIIAMTANAMPGDREKCLSVGMDNYIAKPIDEKELKALLGKYIRFS